MWSNPNQAPTASTGSHHNSSQVQTTVSARIREGLIVFIHDTGIVGIAFSLVGVAIAALKLVLDFDFIESGVEARAPKSLEWYAAFGLMVTLIWLYLEILNLLAKLQGGSRRD